MKRTQWRPGAALAGSQNSDPGARVGQVTDLDGHPVGPGRRRPPTIWLYRDSRGEWRWRLQAANGRITADSAEGYRRRSGAYKAVLALWRDVPRAMWREE